VVYLVLLDSTGSFLKLIALVASLVLKPLTGSHCLKGFGPAERS